MPSYKISFNLVGVPNSIKTTVSLDDDLDIQEYLANILEHEYIEIFTEEGDHVFIKESNITHIEVTPEDSE